jgi:hypothetical protein
MSFLSESVRSQLKSRLAYCWYSLVSSLQEPDMHYGLNYNFPNLEEINDEELLEAYANEFDSDDEDDLYTETLAEREVYNLLTTKET